MLTVSMTSAPITRALRRNVGKSASSLQQISGKGNHQDHRARDDTHHRADDDYRGNADPPANSTIQERQNPRLRGQR